MFDHSSYYKYFHMTPARFDNLLSRIGKKKTSGYMHGGKNYEKRIQDIIFN